MNQLESEEEKKEEEKKVEEKKEEETKQEEKKVEETKQEEKKEEEKKEEEKKVEEKKEEEKKVEEKKEEEKKVEEKKVEEKKEETPESKEEKIEKLMAKGGLKESQINTKFTCVTSETTPLSSIEDGKITIDSPVKVEASSIFSKSYTTYQVKLSEINSTVRRRFSDFDWLQQILNHLYLGNIIPMLSKKNIGDRFSDEFLHTRIDDMTLFLQYIIQDPLLKSSQVVYDFFTIEKDSEFNSKKSTYDKIKKPTNLLQIKSLSGSEKSIVNPDCEAFITKIKFNSDFMISLLNNICDKYDVICEAMKTITNNMKEIAEFYENISKNEFGLPKDIINAFKNLDNHTKDWNELLKNQSNLLSKSRTYLKFLRRELTSIREFYQKVELQKANYYKAEEKLQVKKQSLFDKKETSMSRWEIKMDKNVDQNRLKTDKEYAFMKMLPKDTESVYQSKLIYGYYIYRIIIQFKMIRGHMGKTILEVFNEYFNKQKGLLETFNKGILDNCSFFEETLKNYNVYESLSTDVKIE